MNSKSAKRENPEKPAVPETSPSEEFSAGQEMDLTVAESEIDPGGTQECGKILHSYMEQLSKAVPLDPADEQELWNLLAGYYRRLRSELAFCGESYNFAVRLLEQLDTPESLAEVFPQSLLNRTGPKKLLEKSRFLLQRFSEIRGNLRAAYAASDRKQLQKERKAGAALLAEYPFQNELVLELVEQLRTQRLVMESGDAAACKMLTETMLFCPADDFFSWIKELETLQNELNEVRNKLVFSYLRMVFSIAKKFQGHGVPLVDLIQEGNIGLMKAVNKFDSELGHRFSTYAVWWIKQSVCHAVGRQSRVIRLPMHMLATLNKISREEQQFLLETGREATPEEIAERLNITRERVSSLKRMAMQAISLQAPVYSGSHGRDILLEDTVENIHDGDDPMKNLARKILSDKLSHILSSLPPRTRQVLTLRYGLDGNEPMSLNEMSQHFKISRERIRQIEMNALAKIRNPETISLLEDYFS